MSSVLPFDEDELRQRDAALRRIVRRASWIEADAEDAVQETWLKSLVAPPRDSQRMFAWLRVVALHAVGKIHRGRRNDRRRLRLRARSGEAPSALDELERNTSGARTLDWLHLLEEPYREVLRLRYLEDLSTAEIAARLARREGTVRVQLKRGLDMLRIRAGKDEEKHSAGWLAWLLARSTWRPALACGAFAALVVAFETPGPRMRSGVEFASTREVSSSTPPAPLVVTEVAIPAEARVAATPLPEAEVLFPVVSTTVDAAAESFSLVEGGCYTDRIEPVPLAEIWGAPDARLDEAQLLGRADGAGRYRVRVPADVDWLWADEVLRAPDGTEGQRSGSLRVRLARSTDTTPLGLFFPDGYSISLAGSVVDARGVPVAGARVSTGDRWQDGPALEGKWQIHPHPSTATTDARGEFRLSLFRNAQQDLCVTAPGQPPSATRIAPSATRATIRLPRPAVLTGRLVGPDGLGLSAAALYLELGTPLSELRTETDEAGRFHFELVPPGDLRIRAHPREPELSLVRSLVCEEGAALELGELQATATHSIRGQALEDGEPAAGWRVVLQEDSAVLGRTVGAPSVTETRADGSFEFKACGAARYRAWLLEPDEGDGPARATVKELRPGDASVRLEAVPARATLRGRVENALLSDSQLFLRGDLLPRPATLRTGADGSFERSLPAGSYEVIGLSRTLGEWSVASLELVPGETRRLDCRAPATGSLRIRVQPAPGFERTSLRELQGQLIGAAYRTTFLAGHAGSPAEIDAEEGTLDFAALLPGEYAVLLYTGSAERMGAEYRTVRIVEGRAAELEVQLEPGHRIKVQCRFERPLLEGEQLACTISSQHGDVRLPAGAVFPSGAEAMFVFRKLLAAGSYTLAVESDGGLSGSLELSVPGPEAHVLVLRGSGQDGVHSSCTTGAHWSRPVSR